jgi:hypothetical protein
LIISSVVVELLVCMFIFSGSHPAADLGSSSVLNEGKAAASFCRQVAAWVPDVFCNFYQVKNHKIANNPATSKARKKYAQIWKP